MRKNKQQRQLDEARRERDQVRREGEAQMPRIHRLEKRVRDNHFAELWTAAFARRKKT